LKNCFEKSSALCESKFLHEKTSINALFCVSSKWPMIVEVSMNWMNEFPHRSPSPNLSTIVSLYGFISMTLHISDTNSLIF